MMMVMVMMVMIGRFPLDWRGNFSKTRNFCIFGKFSPTGSSKMQKTPKI